MPSNNFLSFLIKCSIVMLPICLQYNCTEQRQRRDIIPPNSGILLSSMAASLERLHNMKFSGDLAYDFAIMMVAHQQTAIDMNNTEMEKGRRPELLELSKEERLFRSREVGMLERYIRSRPDIDGVNLGKEQPGNIQELVRQMTRDMIANGNTGNVDKDYGVLMLRHAQFTVELCRQMTIAGMTGQMKTAADSLIQREETLMELLEQQVRSL